MTKKNRRKNRVKNTGYGSNVSSHSRSALRNSFGAGSGCDIGASFQINPVQPFQQRITDSYNMYQQFWEAEKIIDIPANDALRNGWSLEGIEPETEKTIVNAADALHVTDKILEALKMERLEGGAVILMCIAGDNDDTALPVDLSSIKPNSLKSLNVIPAHKITHSSYNNDPFSVDYGNPETYLINGIKVHRSRLIIFDGQPISKDVSNGYMVDSQRGFGQGKLEKIRDDIVRAVGTRAAAFELINRSGTTIMSADLSSMGNGFNEGDKALQQLADIANQINMYKSALLDAGVGGGSPTTIQSITPAFGSIPELLMSYLQVLSAASDIPATRFLGQAPGGLNATGQSDLENYYGRIETDQNTRITPRIMQLLEVLGRSCIGQNFTTTDITIFWPPLWTENRAQKAATDKTVVDKYALLVQVGAMSDEDALVGMKEESAIPESVDADNEPGFEFEEQRIDETQVAEQLLDANSTV